MVTILKNHMIPSLYFEHFQHSIEYIPMSQAPQISRRLSFKVIFKMVAIIHVMIFAGHMYGK